MHPNLIDITGRRFGRLLVIGLAGRFNRRTHWDCRCDCGSIYRYQGGNLQQGFTTQCKHCRYKYFKRREGKKYRYKGESKTIREWSIELGLPISTIQSRIIRGHPMRKVFFPGQLPRPPQGRKITFRGVTKSIREWAADLDISIQALKMRLNNWTRTEALTRPNTWKSNGETIERT